MNNFTRFLLATLVCNFAVGGRVATSADAASKYCKVFPAIAYQKADAEELKPLADEFAGFVNVKWVHAAPHNPACCVWLEFMTKPNPGEDGYVIHHQAGGTTICATNAEQMKIALTRWMKQSKKSGNVLTFPEGLTTSFRVIE